MVLYLYTILDRIKVKEESKQEIVKGIRNKISNIVPSYITVHKMFERREEQCNRLAISDGFLCNEKKEEVDLGIDISCNVVESKETLEAIYKVFHYLETLTNSKEQWYMWISYSLDLVHNIKFNITRTEIDTFLFKWYENDILDILKYIAIDRCGDSNIRLKNAYLELENELKCLN